MESVLEQLTESAKSSLETRRQGLSQLFVMQYEKDVEVPIRDSSLDIAAEALAIYKVTVAEVREAETIEEVAAKWKETHALFVEMLHVWQELFGTLNAPKDESFRYCGDVLAKLEALTRKHYEFHVE